MALADTQRWPPLLLAVLAQGLALLGVLLAQSLAIYLFAQPADFYVLLFVQGVTAAVIGVRLGLPRWWVPIQIAFLPLLVGALRLDLPPLLWLAGAALLLLLFRNTTVGRVPLFLSGPVAWRAVGEWLPSEGRFIDLGCGVGGLLLDLAKRFPQARIEGIESAPLPWLIARLRSIGRYNVEVRFADLWHQDLASYDLVFCFLSPQPMLALWLKARAEMQPGALFVSLEFDVPGEVPSASIALADGRTLRLWRIPATDADGAARASS